MKYQNTLPQDSPTGALRYEAGTVRCDVGIYKPEPPAAFTYYATATDDQLNDTWEYVVTDGDRVVAYGDCIEGLDHAAVLAREAFERAVKARA